MHVTIVEYPELIHIVLYLLCAPFAHRWRSCGVLGHRDQWLYEAAFLHQTWWTDWATGHPNKHRELLYIWAHRTGTQTYNAWDMADASVDQHCSSHSGIPAKQSRGSKYAVRYHWNTYCVVVFVLQVPSVDGALGCGVGWLWSSWSILC